MNVQSIEEAEFQPFIQNGKLTLIDFTAPWCPPCKTLLPLLEELSDQYSGDVAIGKVNVDNSPAVAAMYGIMSMPTVIVFKDGQPVDKLVGLRSKEVYRSIIQKHSD